MVPLKKGTPAIIIEVKVLSTDAKDNDIITKQLVELSRKALQQIEEKHYGVEIENQGYSIIKLGIAFYKKQAEISQK